MATQSIHYRAEPSARVITLTPEYARELLDRNPQNRGVSPKNLGVLVRVLERGEWQLNGETIKVDTNGLIIDGQHRCMAVEQTALPVRTFIIEGLPAEVQTTIDTGKTRTLADALTIRGETQAAALASVIRTLCMLDRYGLYGALANKGRLTLGETLAFFDMNPDGMRNIVGPCRKLAQSAHLPTTSAAALWTEFADIDSYDAEYFFGRLVDGNLVNDGGVDLTHPIYVLKKQLATLSENTRGERNRIYLGALVVKAWNKYRDGEPISMLKFRPGGANPEKFPVAH